MPDLAVWDGENCTFVTLRPVKQASKLARIFVRHRLVALGVPEQRIDDGAIVASELVTNVVQHVPWAAEFHLRVSKKMRSALIEVWDPSTARPMISENPEGESGRGLMVVAALATTWYCEILPPEQGGGKIVAALLSHASTLEK